MHHCALAAGEKEMGIARVIDVHLNTVGNVEKLHEGTGGVSMPAPERRTTPVASLCCQNYVFFLLLSYSKGLL